VKRFLVILTSITLLITVVGCSLIQRNSVAGTYYGKTTPSTYIKLKNDGTLTSILNLSGTYEVNGDKVTLLTGLGAYSYQINGTTLIPLDKMNIMFGTQTFAKK
jgi:hypothetical protein